MMTLLSRFEAKVDKQEDGCHLWNAAVSGKGYGVIQVEGKPLGAHRVAYEMYVGPIPDGLQIDHLCRVRSCVNPSHLEPVTSQENTRRGTVVRTHCPQGHEYSGHDGRGRTCKTCLRAASSRHYEILRRNTNDTVTIRGV